MKQRQKAEVKEKQRQKKKVKKTAILIAAILAGGTALFLGGWYLKKNQSERSRDDLSICVEHASLAMHIHPHLSITIKGEPYTIPADIGINAVCMRPVHTHDDSGTLHLEFPYPREVKVGEFFKVWGRNFNEHCIFEQCSGPEGELKMFVNGEQNFDFENYIMQDNDRIEIIFE